MPANRRLGLSGDSGRERAMKSKTYRLFFLDRRLTVRWGEVVRATSDDAATRFATDIIEERDARAVEVWEGFRRVDVIEQAAWGDRI
jgi:hypothetical protein